MKILICLLVAISFLPKLNAQNLTLVKNGKSDYHFVIPEDPDVQEINLSSQVGPKKE